MFRNYINFSGRAQRPEFWCFTLFSFVTQAILNFIPFVRWIYGLVLLLPSLAVTARRLHDTGRSARWLLVPAGVALGWAIIIGAATLVESDGGDGGDGGDGFESLIILLLFGLIWSLFGLIALTIVLAQPGTTGPNRYGPDPLRPELRNDRIPQPAHASDATPDASGVSATGHDVSAPDSLLESEPANRQFCTQCGRQLQAEALFCTVCGTSV